ncbi:MAG: hypothetical protein WAW11_03070 [Patescibacteria group bacterium]
MKTAIKKKWLALISAHKKDLQRVYHRLSLVLVAIAILATLLFVLQTRMERQITESQRKLDNQSPDTPDKVEVPALNHLEATASVVAKTSPNWLSFGDNFSSKSYLNTTKTNMFFDDQITSLIFPPVYEFEKTKDCDEAICGLSGLIFVNQRNVKKPDIIPAELAGRQIVDSRLDKLSSRQVASFIVSEDGQERIFAYFLVGGEFLPILSSDSNIKLQTQYGRGGGQVTVGGSDDDFLIVYSGYEGFAVHYNQGELSDLSYFFGLRVANGGFAPYVIKQGSGSNSLWYILSLNNTKPKLIKLWQNGTSDIVGAYDFSYILNNIDGTLSSFISDAGRGEIKFIFKSPSGPSFLKTFIDNGFDNSIDREAVSVNVNSTNRKILKAKIKSMGLAGQANIFLADDDTNLVRAKTGSEVRFSGGSSTLFWQINFPKSSNREYSPWLNHINYLDYYLAAE